MKLLFLAVLFAYSIASGTGLRCFQCAVSPSICIFKATCDSDELCFSRNFTAGSVTVFTSGCTKRDNCGKTDTDTYLSVTVSTTTQCCDVDLCNGASAVQASMLAIPVMVLAWFLAF